MFTGIIQEIGTLVQSVPGGRGKKLEFACPTLRPKIQLGDSVSCNGVCLTATHFSANSFTAFAVGETLTRSNLDGLRAGAPINLELALTPETRLGGHFVMGHVDGLATLQHIKNFADGSKEITFTFPASLSKYCIEKGSVALNGISLTIAHIEGNQLTVAVIPATLQHTNLPTLHVGQDVNFEVDMLGKYVEKMLAFQNPSKQSLTTLKLMEMGYNA